MSFDEGTEYGERRTSGKFTKSLNTPYSKETKPLPFSSVNRKSLQDLAKEHSLTGDQLVMCGHFIVAMKATEKKILPSELMKIIENWDAIRKAVKTLNVNLE